jgi:hypothetical protein
VVDGRARSVQHLRLERRWQGRTWAEASRILHCRTCGADLTMTEHLARHCAFCGSTHVLVQDNERHLEQPDGLIPFRLGRDHAAEAIHQAQQAFGQRLVSWLTGQRQKLEDLEGIYLPFWVFDGIVEGYRLLRAVGRTDKESLGLTTIENLPLPAVDGPAADLQRAILPFAWQAMVPYKPRLLADWPARLYNQDVELVAERARRVMIGRVRAQSVMLGLDRPGGAARRRSSAEGRGQLDVRQRSAYQVLGTTYQLVLLPVWLGHLVDAEQHKLALVNGLSGKVAL